jgi:hypothetical protein
MSEKGNYTMPTLVKAGVGSRVFSFKDLQAGDIIVNKNGGKYVLPGIPGNGVLNTDLKFTVFTEDFKNPHAGSDGGLNAAKILRLDATPGIELMSEAFRYVVAGIMPKYPITTIWTSEAPAVTAAKKAVADAESLLTDARNRLSKLVK